MISVVFVPMFPTVRSLARMLVVALTNPVAPSETSCADVGAEEPASRAPRRASDRNERNIRYFQSRHPPGIHGHSGRMRGQSRAWRATETAWRAGWVLNLAKRLQPP